MALDYTTPNSGLFVRIGKLLKYINSHLADATTNLPAELKAIADLYEAADLTGQIAGLYGTYDGFKAQVVGLRRSLASYANNTLLDPVTVLSQLGLVTADINAVTAALIQQMIVDAKTVQQCATTVGGVTAAAANVGNGTALVTKLLDGYNAPLLGGRSHIRYAGLNSELAVTSETMTLVCTADSNVSGTREGGERFGWSGGAQYQALDYQTEGSGQGPTVPVANAGYFLVQDGDFENWGGTGNNTPTSWTIDNGTAGTHIFRESGAGNFHRGTYGMKFLGTGAQAVIGVSQAISPTTLKARRCYCVSVRIKASAVPAAGNIKVYFSGTGYAAAASEKIDIAAGAFPTAAFTAAGSLQSFFVVLPALIPSDWKLVVEITGTLSNGVAVYFDSLALAEVVYHGGVGLCVVAGSTRFAIGDRLTFTLTNDDAGKFQKFWRTWFKAQLPSSGAPNIPEALAT